MKGILLWSLIWMEVESGDLRGPLQLWDFTLVSQLCNPFRFLTEKESRCCSPWLSPLLPLTEVIVSYLYCYYLLSLIIGRTVWYVLFKRKIVLCIRGLPVELEIIQVYFSHGKDSIKSLLTEEWQNEWAMNNWTALHSKKIISPQLKPKILTPYI